uniref:endonuclease/exonuclease/phosphatase family protein n=1 Tax=Roseivirga sp. TaxID=1964215 RepID=UPI004048A07D
MKYLICFLIVSCTFLDVKAFQANNSGEILVASLNLLYGTPADLDNTWKIRKSRAIANLQTYKDGIICLQEVNETQIKDVTKGVAGLDVVYRTQGLENGDGKANAILFSKKNWKLIEDETFWLSDTPNKPATKSWGNTAPRIATTVVLENKSSKKRIRVLNVLLDYRSESSRLNSVQLILSKLEGYKEQYPTLLVGDFNATSENLIIQMVRESYTDTYTGEKLEGCTYHSFHGGKNCPRIDYIFHRRSDKFTMIDSGIDRFERNKMYPSDHYLVFAKFSLN